jgi:hypothetical protein
MPPKGDPPEVDKSIKMAARIVVDSGGFFDCMQQLAVMQIRDQQKKRYYFRGESSTSFTLLPTLLRDGVYETLRSRHKASSPIDLQQKLLDRYRRYTQHLIHSDNDFKAEIWADFDTLCLAQHHGLPTLLMDWTLNAYVAAYFAVSGAYRGRIREALAANPHLTQYCVRIWVMRLKAPELRKATTVHLESRKVEWDNRLGNLVMGPVAPLVVVPLVFTRRIAAQNGRFIYCGHSAADNAEHSSAIHRQSLARYSSEHWTKENHSVLSWDQLYSLDILFEIEEWKEVWEKTHAGKDPNDNANRGLLVELKTRLLKASLGKLMSGLEFTGFHAGRLFPDLEGWARYLAEGNL